MVWFPLVTVANLTIGSSDESLNKARSSRCRLMRFSAVEFLICCDLSHLWS